MYFKIHCDYETSKKAGAGGMFQVVYIINDKDEDFTHFIDQGTHYHSLDDVKKDLAKKLQISVDEIELEEV